MEDKDSRRKEEKENNPIKNFCWALGGKEQEECIRNFERVFGEEDGEEEQDEAKKI